MHQPNRGYVSAALKQFFSEMNLYVLFGGVGVLVNMTDTHVRLPQ